ncbi:transcriptional repressor [Xanthomonas albilineans]|uniref:Probable zinc uptake regulator protein n=1 Tax=Xanthomonas albilineans (strain GPE PC73 / CFBP 7063) TaxID=380358 RepID=D2UEH1_XANAP|nr:transcriptional repressor [Xanthomonas albilineans]PPU92264.1 Fur family transcriptional regulator [Xanthomonas albilineans]QHQ28788.1 putative zinc uptake regulator protein [Xanthomonas albilineans]CBA16545.1 probable zinc uptake regulator protein [Xanthomonas albilineans GPE PC73]
MPSKKHACIDPQHHVHDPADFVTVAERVSCERGLRLTPIRANLLRLIVEAARPVKAYELLEWVREGRSVGANAPPTVYRALDFLMANGFVHKLESVNAFVACHHPSSALHSVPFLICDRCHSAVELEDRDVVEQLEQRAKALGFQPQAQTLEVHGLCARCANG